MGVKQGLHNCDMETWFLMGPGTPIYSNFSGALRHHCSLTSSQVTATVVHHVPCVTHQVPCAPLPMDTIGDENNVESLTVA